MNEQNLQRLHQSLSGLDSNFTRTFPEFVQDMQDEDKRHRLHANLGKIDSGFTRTYEEFSADMGLPIAAQERAQEAQEAGEQAKEQLKQGEDITRPDDLEGEDSFYNLSDDEINTQIAALNTARDEKRAQEREKIKKSKGFLARLGDAMYEAHTGVSSTTRDEMMVEGVRLDPKDEDRYNRLIQEQVWRRQQAGSEYEQLGKALVTAKDNLDAVRDSEGRGLDTGGAGAYLDKAIKLYQAPSKFGNSNGIKNWAAGLGDQLADYDTWTVGVTEMARAINLNALVNKLNKGEELDATEQAELEAFLLYGMVQDARQNDLSTGYTIGKGTAESIPFMAEMFITAGMGAAAKKGLVKLLVNRGNSVAAKRLARAFGDELTEVTVKKGSRAVRDVVLKEIKQNLAERAVRQVGDDVLMTAFMPTTWANVADDAVEEKLNGDGEYGFGDFVRSFAGSTIETGTEHWGGKIVDKAIGKVMPLDKIWGKTRWGKLLTNDFIQSPFGETGEEYVGAIANYIRSYDPAYSQESNEELRKEARQMFSIDGFMQTFLTVLPMSLVGGSVNVGVTKHHIKEYQNSKGEIISLLKEYGADDEQASNIMLQIEGAEDTKAFTEMIAQTIRTLKLEYMNTHPDAKIEDLEKHFADLDKLMGKYYKSAYYLNEASGELQEAYSKLTEEEQQKVMNDFAATIGAQAQDADKRIQENMRKAEERATVKTETQDQTQSASPETSQEQEAEQEQETEVKVDENENPAENPDEPKQILPRDIEIELNGSPVTVKIAGKGVYADDGSIDFGSNRRIYLLDENGTPFGGTMRSEVEEALNSYLRQEKENGDALMAQDQPVATADTNPVADTAEQAQAAEQAAAEQQAAEQAQQKQYPVLEDGTPDFEQIGNDPVMTIAAARDMGLDINTVIDSGIASIDEEIANTEKSKKLTILQKQATLQNLRQQKAAWEALKQENVENVDENLAESEKNSNFAQNSDNNDSTGVQGESESGNQPPQSQSEQGGLGGDRAGLGVVSEPSGEGRPDNSGLEGGSLSVAAIDTLDGLNDEIDSKLESKGIRFPKVKVVRVGAKDFHDAIAEGRAKNEDGWRVDVHDEADYENCYCILTEDGHAGIAVKPDGDIVSLFSDNTHRGVSRKLLLAAIANGGRKADFFMTPNKPNGLQNIYWHLGARITGQMPFSEAIIREFNPDWIAYHDKAVQEFGEEEGHRIATNHPTAAAIFPATIDDAIAAYEERKSQKLEDIVGTIELPDGQVGIAGIEVFDDYDQMLAKRDEELANENTPEQQQEETINLNDDGIAILLHDVAEDKVPLVKVARVSNQDGVTTYTEIGTGRTLDVESGYWNVMEKQTISEGENDFIFINHKNSSKKGAKRLGIPAYSTEAELAAINAQNENRPKVEKVPNRGLTSLTKEARGKGVGYFEQMPLDGVLTKPLTRVGNTGETLTLQDILAMSPVVTTNANGRKVRRTIWNQVTDWCEQAAIRSMQKAEGSEYSEERMKELRRQLTDDIKKAIPQMIDGWNRIVQTKGLDELLDSTFKDENGEYQFLNNRVLETFRGLRQAIWGDSVEDKVTLVIPVNNVRFTEGWYNPSKGEEHPLGEDANIFRYLQVVGEMARQLQDAVAEEGEATFLNVERGYEFPYYKTVAEARVRKGDNAESQFRAVLEKIANAANIEELRKIAQVRYSWQEKQTRKKKSDQFEDNPNYDIDKANAVEEALSQRASDFGASFAELQSEDKIAKKEAEMSDEERAAAAAAEDIASEEETSTEEQSGLEATIAMLEAEREKKMGQLQMARSRKNEEIEQMLLEEINTLAGQIFALRRQMTRGNIGTSSEQRARRVAQGRKVVDALRGIGVNITMVNEDEMLQFFDEEEARLLRDGNAVPYGVAIGSDIYVLEDYLDANTPIHEYTHLWVDVFSQKNPEKWQEIVEVLKQTAEWNEVLNDEYYAGIREDEYEVASEVMARLTGDYWSGEFLGKNRFDDATEQKTLEVRVRMALRDFWESVCGWLGRKLNKRSKDFEKQLEKILNMPMEEALTVINGGLTQEEEEIKAKALADGTYMKAPNGADTHLTEKQWLQVRTRAFMDWFGDWIKGPRLEKLRNSEPIEVSFNNEYELNRDSAKAWALENLRGDYTNADTGEVINVYSEGINKVTSHGEREVEHLKSLIAIPKMIEKSIFIEELANEKGNDKYDTYRYYVCGLNIDGVEYTAKVVIGVKNGERYYDHRLTQIEKGRLIDSLNPMANRVAENQASKIDGKDTKLFSILQTNSKKNADFSRILDENGEPKVVYRGSKNPNTYIFHSHYQSGAVWFTDDIEVARHYATRYADHRLSEEEIAARIQPVFLSAFDIQEYDAQGRRWEEAVEEPVYFVLNDDGDVLASSRNREEMVAYCQQHGLNPEIDITESTATGDVAEVDLLNGKEGVVFHNIIDGGDKASTVYTLPNNGSAKSATQNIGTFNANMKDIRLRVAPNTDITENEPMPAGTVQRMNWLQRKVNAALDQANGLRLLMKNIGEIEGEKVSADEDVREALEAKRSKITNILTRFGYHQRRHFKKALRAIQNDIKKSGLWKKGMTDYYINSDGVRADRDVKVINILEMYMMAKDTLERISQGKPVRAKELSFRALQWLDMPVETEIETQEQQQAVLQSVVEKFEGAIDEEKVNDLWKATNECTNFTLDMLKQGGLLGAKVYEELKKSKFYVPERGFAQLESDEEVRQEVDGRKKGTRGTNPEALRTAHGGESMATDVIAHILHLATNSVACAQENLVRQAAFNLLRNHSDACAQLGYPAAERVWYVRDGFNEDGSPRYTASVERPSAEMIAQNDAVLELIRGYREDLELFKGNNEMTEHINSLIEEAKKELLIVNRRDAGDVGLSRAGLAGEDVPKVLVSVPTEDGDVQQYTMVFPNQREIANALNGVLATKFSDSWLKTVGHFFSSMFTTYNPLFWSRNLPRDAMFVLQKGTAERGLGYGAFFAAEMARPATTILPIIEYVMGLDVDGRASGSAFSADGDIEREFRAFLDGGGNTGFTQLKDIAVFRKEADKLVNGENPVGAGLGFLFKEVPAALNEFSELWTRFAVYRATKASLAMENGIIRTLGRSTVDLKRTKEYTPEEIEALALHDSRNFSTNFNRRGAGGFVDFFNSISMFANASIQGAMGVYRTFEEGNIQKGIRGSMSLMIVPAFLGYLLTKLTPDDDDKEKWIPDYIRQNNLVFLDKRMPLSYELVPWYRIGVNYALMEQGRLSKTDGIENIAMGFAEHSLPTPPAISDALKTTIDCVVPETDYNGKNPSIASALNSLMRAQFLSSFVELEHGKTWTGSNLRFSYAQDKPQWMFQDYEAELYKDISKGLYKLSGGDMNNPSITIKGKKMNDFQNMSPKEVKNYIGSITPNGWTKIACFAWGLGKEVFEDGDFVRDNDRPLVSDFVLSQDAEMGRIGISAEMSAMIREAKENYTRIGSLRDLDEKEAKAQIRKWDNLYREYTDVRVNADDIEPTKVKAYKRRLERQYGIKFDGESVKDLQHAYIVVMTNEQIEAKGLERTVEDMERWRSKYRTAKK